MKVILPVAGIGKRLRPHTLNKPKALIPLVGKPILEYIIDRILELKNVDEIILILGYLGSEIKTFVKTKYEEKVKLSFVFQKKMLGLGHAIHMADKNINKNDDILIMLGDTIIDLPLKEFVNYGTNVIGVKKVTNPHRFGVVNTNSEDLILEVEEKPENPKSDLAIVGLYYFKHGKILMNILSDIIKNNIKIKNEFQLTTGIEMLLKKEDFKAFKVDEWFDCGDVPTLMETNKYLLSKLKNKTTYDANNNNIYIKPYYLGENVSIKDSIIGPNTSVSNCAKIKNSIVKNSIISNNSDVKNMLLQDSIIGSEAFIKGNFSNINISNNSGYIMGD